MNIIEAIKSGKPFKRKDWQHYYAPNGRYLFFSDAVLADDWEVEDTSFTVTERELRNAFGESNFNQAFIEKLKSGGYK
jgi:hypothetical protein